MKRTRIHWRIWHRRLAWLVGAQLLLWAISGAYMVWLELDYIRGASHTNPNGNQVLAPQDVHGQLASSAQVLERYESVTAITLRPLPNDQWIYQVDLPYSTILLDAVSLAPKVLQQKDIIAFANGYRINDSGPIEIESVHLITKQLPQEVSFAQPPVWQVTYADFINTTLYIDAASGALVSTRHNFWRLFDFMWMLHIMDYDDRSDISTWWAQLFMVTSLVFVITGILLLLLQLRRLGRRFHA